MTKNTLEVEKWQNETARFCEPLKILIKFNPSRVTLFAKEVRRIYETTHY